MPPMVPRLNAPQKNRSRSFAFRVARVMWSVVAVLLVGTGLFAAYGTGFSWIAGRADAGPLPGVAPALAMYKKGARVGLGTDGPMSGNTLDVIGQLGYVAKVHKLNK